LLILIYGVILAAGAKVISDGSEGLLDLFPTYGTVIGALLLPVLGAIPDSAMIVVSGALGPRDQAQEQLSVGMGTLAGSTIMLLTVPWAASLWVGRCDMNEFGEAKDKVLTSTSLTRNVVSVDDDTRVNARIMLGTSLSYFIVQGVAFYYIQHPDSPPAEKMEGYFALAGMIICFILLIAYCVYQVLVPKLAEKRAKKAEALRLERSYRLRAYHAAIKMGWFQKQDGHEQKHAEVKALAIGRAWKRNANKDKKEEEKPEETPLVKQQSIQNTEEVDDDDEEEEDNSPKPQRFAKAITMLILGTLLVTFFSDPMVDVINQFGKAIHVSAFYISFIVTPYCSNASETISSLIFAAKKRKTNSSMTYSQLYGAATMNNTMGLGIFFLLIYFRKFAWTFSAETLSIFTITLIVGVIGQSLSTFKLYWAIVVIALYPLSLVFVWILETQAHWQ